MINKDKNKNLQLTLNKKTFECLERLQSEYIARLGTELTKSQVITILINEHININRALEIAPKKTDSKTNEKATDKNEIQAKLIALKSRLNESWPQMSDRLDIPTSTLKKYAMGKQKPTNENQKKLDTAFKTFNII